jgi:manganese transport protein
MATLGLADNPITPLSHKLRSIYLLGPAFVAGVAYLDPGNVATNLTAGGKYGYLLLWVIVAANLSAWLVQYLSAKFGIVSGKSIPQIMGETITNPYIKFLYWAQAQLVAIATDVAEIIGGAIALHLLFNLPLLAGAVATGTFSILHLAVKESGKAKLFELIILVLIAITAIGFTSGLFVAPVDSSQMLQGFIPGFQGKESLLIAVSIFGATIMPHAIYAHSALCRDRAYHRLSESGKKRVITATRWDVSLAMLVAGLVNIGIFLIGAVNLFGHHVDDSIIGAHQAIKESLGPNIAIMFAVGLLASGIASSSVGTYASGVISSGLLNFKLSIFNQRAIALIPALIVIQVASNPTMALVFSQVVLSIGIPFALFPLIYLTSKKAIMGSFVNSKRTQVVGYLLAILLTGLNLTMIALLLA